MTTTSTTKFSTVDEYLSTFPDNMKTLLEKVRKVIQKAAPEAKELISYNIPGYKLNWMLIYFAGWKEHISIYPVPKGDAAFQQAIEKYRGGKGTLKFPLGEPLPIDLIRKAVKFRIKENLEKAKGRKKGK